MNNREFAEKDYEFKVYCDRGKVKNTKRQASKFKSKKGTAYKFWSEAKE